MLYGSLSPSHWNTLKVKPYNIPCRTLPDSPVRKFNHSFSTMENISKWKYSPPSYHHPNTTELDYQNGANSEFPGISHHHNKVDICIDGGAHTSVIIHKLLLGHLQRGAYSFINAEESFTPKVCFSAGATGLWATVTDLHPHRHRLTGIPVRSSLPFRLCHTESQSFPRTS